MTNREYLRTLTDEELLKIIYIYCDAMKGGECPKTLTCRGCQLKWLNEEHKENDDEI